MGEALSVDELHAVNTAWEQAVVRAAAGETVAVISQGRHIADVVAAGEVERLRETLEILSDPEAVRALHDQDYSAYVGLDEVRQLLEQRARQESPRD